MVKKVKMAHVSGSDRALDAGRGLTWCAGSGCRIEDLRF